MSSYLSDLEHKRIEARVHRDRVTETHFISDIRKGIRRTAEKKTWRVKEVIGRGSFGQVRLEVCEDGQNIARERAVKKITLDLASAGNKRDKDTLKARQYENELKALLEFSKPKYREMSVFVEFLGWFEDGFDLFIAMEYLCLDDLEKNLPASGKLPEGEVKVITKQILDGLEIMHLESFAHRDLKPQNVLVAQGSPNWWIKLADFGLTKRLTESTQFNTHAGTLAYMAPEMLDKGGDNSDYTHAVDIWALGCIVFRLLTNSVPFPSAWELFKYCDDPSAFPSEKLFACEASFLSADLIMKLLKAQPTERPTSSQALKHQWLPSDAASLKGSERSRASTDSERLMVLEDTPHPVVDLKRKSAMIAPESRLAGQEVSIGGYDTATNPALKSLVTSPTTTDILRQPQVPLSKPEKDQNGPRTVDRQYLVASKSQASLNTPSREPSPFRQGSPFIQELNQKMGRTSPEELTPKTISPKDAVLFHPESEEDANISLFSTQSAQSQPAKFREKPKGSSELDNSVSQQVSTTLPPIKEAKNSLLMEYFEGEKGNEADSPRPSVRVKVTPSLKNKSRSLDNNFQIPERKETRKPLSTKQIQLSPNVNTDDSPEDEGEGEPGRGRENESLPPGSLACDELPERKEPTAAANLRGFSTRRHAAQQKVVPLLSPSGKDLPEDPFLTASAVIRDPMRTQTPPSPTGYPRNLPEGWKAQWNEEYRLWFYVNIYTFKSQWEKPTEPNYPPYDGDAVHTETTLEKDNILPDPQALLFPEDVENDDRLKSPDINDGDRNNIASPSASATSRAKSLGQARRESIKARRARREEDRARMEEARQLQEDYESLEKDEDLKPVFLKGLFSVSTTSSKPISVIRADIIRVLVQLGVEFTEIRGGFSCRHTYSVGLKDYTGAITSEISNQDSSAMKKGENTKGQRERPMELGGIMHLEFEVFIIKVPLVKLHGIQFKGLTGATWQYQNITDKILKELRL